MKWNFYIILSPAFIISIRQFSFQEPVPFNLRWYLEEEVKLILNVPPQSLQQSYFLLRKKEKRDSFVFFI